MYTPDRALRQVAETQQRPLDDRGPARSSREPAPKQEAAPAPRAPLSVHARAQFPFERMSGRMSKRGVRDWHHAMLPFVASRPAHGGAPPVARSGRRRLCELPLAPADVAPADVASAVGAERCSPMALLGKARRSPERRPRDHTGSGHADTRQVPSNVLRWGARRGFGPRVRDPCMHEPYSALVDA